MKEQIKNGFLTGKKVVLLGASSGIGFATAKAAAAEGAEIVIISSNQERIDAALAAIPEGGAGYQADLSDEEQVKNLFKTIGNFDHLVYTAGENIQLGILAETEIEAARKFFNLRYWGAVTAVKYATPFLNQGGSVVLTSGIASLRPGSGWSVASSICSAMEGFTRAMAIELAPIRVNIVSPGVIRTNLWGSMTAEERDGMYAQIGNALPVKRVGEAEDVAENFIYLMKQKFVTGQVLIVDGGTVLV